MNDVQVQHYAEIALNLPIDGLYTYSIPTYMEIQVGHAVLVPFGRKRISGYVVNITSQTELETVKSIEKLLDPNPVFDARMLNFFSMGFKILFVRIGRGDSDSFAERLQRSINENFVATEQGIEALALVRAKEQSELSDIDRHQMTALREVIARPNLSLTGLSKRLEEELEQVVVERAIARLLEKEWIRAEEKN